MIQILSENVIKRGKQVSKKNVPMMIVLEHLFKMKSSRINHIQVM